jgi:hypothetical protein
LELRKNDTNLVLGRRDDQEEVALDDGLLCRVNSTWDDPLCLWRLTSGGPLCLWSLTSDWSLCPWNLTLEAFDGGGLGASGWMGLERMSDDVWQSNRTGQSYSWIPG